MIGFLTHSHHTQPPHSATHSHTQPSHSCHTRPHTATQSPHTSTTLNHSPWRRRVLVLVEIIPDSGEVRGVHVSALDKGRKKWYTISGWEGFWSRDDGDEPDPEPLLRIAPCARAPADGPSAAQLRCLSRKFRAEGVHDEHDDSWVPLACFLRAVGKAKEVAQA